MTDAPVRRNSETSALDSNAKLWPLRAWEKGSHQREPRKSSQPAACRAYPFSHLLISVHPVFHILGIFLSAALVPFSLWKRILFPELARAVVSAPKRAIWTIQFI